MTTPRSRAVGAMSLMVTIALTATACTSDTGGSDDPGSDASGTTGATATPAPLETTATIGRVTGKLAGSRGKQVTEQVSGIVDAWIDAAYVAGDYPRSDFEDAFPGFSSGARLQARANLALMSNAQLGDRIDGVQATKRRVRVDVLAVKRRAVGVTARFVLEFNTLGDVMRSQHVEGRLYLSRNDGDWQIFGYDVSKGIAR